MTPSIRPWVRRYSSAQFTAFSLRPVPAMICPRVHQTPALRPCIQSSMASAYSAMVMPAPAASAISASISASVTGTCSRSESLPPGPAVDLMQ